MAAGLGSTWWQYLLLFLAVAASWAGVPAIGTAALGAAAVAASQGRLELAAVIAVAAIAGEAGGLGGYAIGRRWGRQLLGRPGRHHARRVRPPAIRPQDRRPGPGHGVEQRRHPVRRVILGAVVYGETLSHGGGHVAPAIIGLALAVAGVVLLARAEGPAAGETSSGDGVPAPAPAP
ncbi:MAG: hypothetical protein ACLP5E_27250 [Streptosporangiaceae bacterium]